MVTNLLFSSYIYSGTLPQVMTIDTAKELTAMASHNPKKLSHLVDLCKGFIENIALKKGEGGCVAVEVAGL